MKKLLFIFVSTTFLVSCSSNVNNQDQLKAKLIQDKRQQIDQIIEPDQAKSKLEESNLPFPTARKTGAARLMIAAQPRVASNRVPVISVRQHEQLYELDVMLQNFKGSRQIYFYVDQNYKGTEPVGSSTRTSLNLLGHDLDNGLHTVTAVQFENDDITQPIINYVQTKYRVK